MRCQAVDAVTLLPRRIFAGLTKGRALARLVYIVASDS